MDEPTTEPIGLGARLGRPPAGVQDFAVYHPVSCPGERADAEGLTLRLGDFNASVIAELIDASPAERNALFECIDHYLSKNRTRIAVNEREEMLGLVDASPNAKVPFTLFQLRERCTERSSRGSAELDYVGLGGKLTRLMHAKTFDEPGKPALDVAKLLAPGRLSVLDVSAASEVVQNLVTADVLRKPFAYKMLNDDAPPTLVVIEEAHSFISKDRVESLYATLGMLRMVARRGRKRWLSLAFVSQQPGHLPQEVFELCNTRIVHNLRSQSNLDALRSTAGDVAQSLWDHCPLLGPGEALVSSPQLKRAVVARIRHASSRRKFIR
jgi:DNA helicase HerA-like ATPase